MVSPRFCGNWWDVTVRVKSTATFCTKKCSSSRQAHGTELYVRCRGAVAVLGYRARRGFRWYWIFIPYPHLVNLEKRRAQLRIAVVLTWLTTVICTQCAVLTSPPWDSCTTMWSVEASAVRWNSGSGCPLGGREMGRRTRETRTDLFNRKQWCQVKKSH